MPPPASTTISRNLAPKNWQEMSFKWELLPNFLPKSSDKKSEMASHGPWTTFYKDCLVSLVGWIDCACLCSQQMKTSIQSIPPALWKGCVAFLMWGKSGGFDPPFPDNWPQWHVSYGRAKCQSQDVSLLSYAIYYAKHVNYLRQIHGRSLELDLIR